MKFTAQITFNTIYQPAILQVPRSDKRLMYYLSLGFVHQKIEAEMFGAEQMLLQIANALMASQFDNIVRISHNKADFYVDINNRPHDLTEEIKRLAEEIRFTLETFNQQIVLVVERTTDSLNFLVELKIKRVHLPNEKPFVINFEAVANSKASHNQASKDFEIALQQIAFNLKKYVSIDQLQISNIRKDNQAIAVSISDAPADNKAKAAENVATLKTHGEAGAPLFPLYGITLGRTTIEEIKTIGTHATDKDDKGKLFKYYVVENTNFWYGSKYVEHMYLTRYDALPPKWNTELGFTWSLSYDEWIQLCKRHGFVVAEIMQPTTKKYDGHKSFWGEISASFSSGGINIEIILGFRYSKGTRSSDADTLYNMSVRFRS